MSIHLGRLKKVDLREFFKDEARDFTPWLAEEENLELLGETLGIDIKLQYQIRGYNYGRKTRTIKGRWNTYQSD